MFIFNRCFSPYIWPPTLISHQLYKKGAICMPWYNIFSAFLFHSNFKSHLGDGWDGQDLASPWCWREEALLPSVPLPACIDSYSSSNSESCSKHLCLRQCHANCPRLCPCVLSPNYSSLQKNCPTQKTAFFVFMLFWDGRRFLEKNRKKGRKPWKGPALLL